MRSIVCEVFLSLIVIQSSTGAPLETMFSASFAPIALFRMNHLAQNNNWTKVNPKPSAANLFDVASNGDTFVILGHMYESGTQFLVASGSDITEWQELQNQNPKVGTGCTDAHIVYDAAFGFFALQTSQINGNYQNMCWFSRDGYNWSSTQFCNPSLENFVVASNGAILATTESETQNNYDFAYSNDGGHTWSRGLAFKRPTGRPSIIAGKFVMPVQDTLFISSDAAKWNIWLNFSEVNTTQSLMKTNHILHAFKSFEGDLYLFLADSATTTNGTLIRLPPPFVEFQMMLSTPISSRKIEFVQNTVGEPIYVEIGSQTGPRNFSVSHDGITWSQPTETPSNYRATNEVIFALGAHGKFYISKAGSSNYWHYNDPGIVSPIQSMWYSSKLSSFIMPTTEALYMSVEGASWRSYKLQLRSVVETDELFLAIDASTNKIIQTHDFIQLDSFDGPSGGILTAIDHLPAAGIVWAAVSFPNTTNNSGPGFGIFYTKDIRSSTWTRTETVASVPPESSVSYLRCTKQYCAALISSNSNQRFNIVRWYANDGNWLQLSVMKVDSSFPCRLDMIPSEPYQLLQYSCNDPRVPNWFSTDGNGWGVNAQHLRFVRWLSQQQRFIGMKSDFSLQSGSSLDNMTEPFKGPDWRSVGFDYIAANPSGSYVAVSSFDRSIYSCRRCA